MASSSSTLMAAVNLAKLCIGAGVLALPYGSLHGGLVFAPIGIAIVAAWNGVACTMIMRCKRACQWFDYPQTISSTYARIAYAAIGWIGVYITDFSIIFTLLGVCISFQITFATLMKDIPFVSFSYAALTAISATLVYPISCVPSIALLSSFSLAGLVFLMLGIIAIFFSGISLYGSEALEDITGSHHGTSGLHHPVHALWPASISDMASYVGVAVFCFGLSSLAFPVEESMKHKHEFNKAVLWSLLFVWTVYTIVGDGGALLYSHDPNGIKDNILENLPKASVYATFVRLSMALVCVLTYPLTLIPPAQMIEFHLAQKLPSSCTRLAYEPILDEDTTSGTAASGAALSPAFRYATRFVLIGACTLVASYVPCFGLVVSLLGCFTVSILSFVLPPFLHLRLVTQPQLLAKATRADMYKTDTIGPESQYYIDLLLTLLGLLLCVGATSIMVYQLLLNSPSMGACAIGRS